MRPKSYCTSCSMSAIWLEGPSLQSALFIIPSGKAFFHGVDCFFFNAGEISQHQCSQMEISKIRTPAAYDFPCQKSVCTVSMKTTFRVRWTGSRARWISSGMNKPDLMRNQSASDYEAVFLIFIEWWCRDNIMTSGVGRFVKRKIQILFDHLKRSVAQILLRFWGYVICMIQKLNSDLWPETLKVYPHLRCKKR